MHVGERGEYCGKGKGQRNEGGGGEEDGEVKKGKRRESEKGKKNDV